ncbi:MAG: hypothetical protein WC615_01345 [Mucilaginibacter sp.]|jgi:hypothetical protein|uniref:hypothetical protein n=1 Tax=Mucilaginibacter sp. TaxID=1882438 RepID=UPI003562DF42
MKIASDQDIIDQLKEKLRYHQQQYKRIEDTLAAFLTEQAHQDSISSDLPAYRITENAPDFRPAEPETGGGKAKKTLQVPVVYKNTMTFTKKIAFALKSLGEGFREEIAGVIVGQEPDLDATTIEKTISGVLSSLKIRGLIGARREGRRDKFFLI